MISHQKAIPCPLHPCHPLCDHRYLSLGLFCQMISLLKVPWITSCTSLERTLSRTLHNKPTFMHHNAIESGMKHPLKRSSHSLMGIHKVPSVSNYWSQHALLGVPGITRNMSRNRFMQTLQNLHLNDNSKMPQPGDPNFDKLYKVRPLLETIRTNSQKAYSPLQEVSVDEAMVLFKGRSSMKQYMPLKPIKRGYKVWCLCDAINGYTYNIQVYTGASDGSNEDTLGSRVVKNMVRPIKGRGHHVYMDKFFTSISLAKDLLDDTFMIGTARSGRKGWPLVLKELKALKKALKRGESRSVVVEDGKVECLVWKDNTVVPLVNTITKPQDMTSVKRTNKDGSRIDVSCPENIKSYNKFMGGVNLFDSRRKTYSCSRRSKKWWLRLFYFLLDMTTVKPSSYTSNVTAK